MRKKEKGFTLVEMLVVLFVIAVILAIVLPNLAKTGSVAEDKAEEANKRMLLAQAENYRLVEGDYPKTVGDLVDKGYIEAAPECGDGGSFQFHEKNGKLTVSCAE